MFLVRSLDEVDREQSEDLSDYKFYCFDGVVKFVMINSDRNSNKPTKADYFDRDLTGWIYLGIPTR